ncbi:hypothetical protein [Streptosporangium vulgare]|uniref:Uncharacterized protein n=1 Tax=Streptosporangium vulgare TaxID=46190 RepID=A0ABV5TAN6_9ACTN
MSTVRLPFEWAVGGKLPGSGDDYKILACSQGLLSYDDFEEIRTVYTIGTPETLPQVMIAWVGSGDDAHLVLAIQRWSDEEDRQHRRIARTNYFCVPYSHIARSPRPVSYEDLYHVLKECPLPMEGQLVVSVPTLDSGALAARVDGSAMTTAALLMTGQQVCVVEGEAVPMIERLRFLDMVAALLPYGMRARLAVSTWASSTADHKIRLAFTQHVPARTYPVVWGHLAHIPDVEEDAYHYLALLGRHDPDAKLIDWLAARTEPLTFGRNGRGRALDLLRGFAPSSAPALMPPPAPVPARPPVQEPLEGLLTECADVLESGRTAEIRAVLERLDGVVASRGQMISDDERARYQKIIEDRRLLAPRVNLPEDLEAYLHVMVRMAGQGPTSAQAGVSTQDEGLRTGAPTTAVVRRPPPDPVASMKAAYQQGREELDARLRLLRTTELVAEAARRPYEMRTVRIARDELVKRGDGNAKDPNVAEALREYDYLADAIDALYSAGSRAGFDLLSDLLRAAYGQELDSRAFEQVFPSLSRRQGTLIAAAVVLSGVDAGEALKQSVVRLVHDSGLDREIVERVEERLRESEPSKKRWSRRERQGVKDVKGGKDVRDLKDVRGLRDLRDVKEVRNKSLVPTLTLYFLVFLFATIALVEFFMLIPGS